VSAPALRAPARSWPVARSYLSLLAGRRAAWVCVAVATPGIFFMAGGNPWGFRGVAFLFPFLPVLPQIQWKQPGQRGPLEPALPIGRVRNDLLWVGCGAAWAATVLALIVGLTAALVAAGYGGPDGGSGLYPFLLFAVGLGYYLFGAAFWLSLTRPLSLVIMVALASATGMHPPARLERLLALRIAPTPGEALGLVGPAALWLAAGAAAVGLAVSMPTWDPSGLVRRGRAALRRVPRSRPGLPAGKPRTLSAGARRQPPPLGLVLWREIVLFRRRMTWLVASALCIVLWLVPGMVGDSGPMAHTSASVLFAYALSWSNMVWLMGRVSTRGGTVPLPVGMAAQRLVRVAAGAVWLEVTVLAALAARAAGVGEWGEVGGSPEAAVGIASCALVLYLLGSVGTVLARRPGGGWMLAWFFLILGVFPLVMSYRGHSLLAPGSVLSVFGPRPEPWLPAAMLWGTVLAALVWAAAARGAARERGRPWSPARAGKAA
jgi:hypothetical protein